MSTTAATLSAPSTGIEDKATSATDWLFTVEYLPPAPSILPRLLGVIADPKVELAQIVNLISLDPALAAKILRLCNSAFFGSTTPTTDLAEAAFHVGLEFIHRLAVSVSTHSIFQSIRPEWGVDVNQMWKHSVTTALAAQTMATDRGEDSATLFAAGLLHDVGKGVMASVYHREYGQLVAAAQGNPRELLTFEKETFGFDHAEVGGELLQQWNLPPTIAEAVLYHHAPQNAPTFQRYAAYLNLADIVAFLAQQRTSEKPLPFDEQREIPGELEALGFTGLTREERDVCVDQTLKNFKFVEAMCKP